MNKVISQLAGVMLRFLLTHAIGCLALALTGSDEYLRLSLLLLPTMFLYFFFRKRIHHAAAFVSLHAGVLLVCVFFANRLFTAGLSAVEWGCLLFALGDSLRLRVSKREFKSFSGLSALVFAGGFIVSAYFDRPAVMQICLWDALLFVGFKIVFDGLSNINEFLEVNDKVSEMPVMLIQKRTGIFLAVFVALVVLGMNWGLHSGIDELIEKAGHFLLELMRFHPGEQGGEVTQQVEFSMFSDAPLPDVSGLQLEVGRTLPPVFAILGRLLVRIALVSAGFFIVKALYVKLRFVMKGLYHTKDENEFSEFVFPIKDGFAVSVRQKLGLSKIKDASPNNAKIRKLYKKYIMKNKRGIPEKSLTPYEISKKLQIEKEQYDADIRGLYEKAKYGQEECTQKEVGEMKGYIMGR